jgi:aconitase A
MKYLIGILLCSLLFSCSDTFINHTLSFEKAGDCTAYQPGIKMVSNINGERYQFDCCMDESFNGKNYTIERKGDTINVSFPKASARQSLFKITLDIDAKPAYHLINIDGKEIHIVASEK